MDRRSFFSLLPAATTAGLAVPEPETKGIDQGTIHAAGQVSGMEFTDAQERMALPSITRNLTSYQALRGHEVPLDTEPAIAFHPALPGRKIGPICRGVEDCAAVLDAIHGPDGRDPTVTDIPFRWAPEEPLAQIRIGNSSS